MRQFSTFPALLKYSLLEGVFIIAIISIDKIVGKNYYTKKLNV